jgi:hypothetical protein
MPSIGHILREAREKRGVSVSDVSRATHIKGDYIEQMEADRFDRLIAPAYARSFLRMYSDYLGLNTAAILEQLRSWQPGKTPSAPAPPPVARKPAMPSATASQPRWEQAPPSAQPPQPAAPRPPSRETPREPALPTAQPTVAAGAHTPPTTERRPSAPSRPVAETPPPKTPPAAPLRLKNEPKKSSSPPPVAAPMPQRSFLINATLVVVIVATVALTGIIWLWQQRNKPASTDDQNLELKARKTVRASPARAADVLPLPPAP